METRTSKPRESWEQAVNRLALQAQVTGVTIYGHDLGTQVEFFATSVSRPGTLHRVTLLSCDCDGFVRHQRCSHVAALLAEVGELPPLPAPATPEAMSARRAERVQDWHHHNEAHARHWLESLIAKQERGETVPERDLLEACDAVNTYAAITGSTQAVALAA